MLDFFRDIPALKLQRTAFLMARRADKELHGKTDLTMPQFMLLLSIKEKEKCNQAEIAGMRHLSEAAISRMVEGLLDKGFLTRDENPENRREHILELTDEGQKIVQKGLVVVKDNMEEILGRLSTEDRAKLDQLLDKILAFVYTETGHYA